MLKKIAQNQRNTRAQYMATLNLKANLSKQKAKAETAIERGVMPVGLEQSFEELEENEIATRELLLRNCNTLMANKQEAFKLSQALISSQDDDVIYFNENFSKILHELRKKNDVRLNAQMALNLIEQMKADEQEHDLSRPLSTQSFVNKIDELINKLSSKLSKTNQDLLHKLEAVQKVLTDTSTSDKKKDEIIDNLGGNSKKLNAEVNKANKGNSSVFDNISKEFFEDEDDDSFIDENEEHLQERLKEVGNRMEMATEDHDAKQTYKPTPFKTIKIKKDTKHLYTMKEVLDVYNKDKVRGREIMAEIFGLKTTSSLKNKTLEELTARLDKILNGKKCYINRGRTRSIYTNEYV